MSNAFTRTLMSLAGAPPSKAALLDKARVPQHIAVIMDGNGRWARKRALPTKVGHKKGAEALRALLEGSRDLGFSYLTVYAFSSENWQRSQEEVADLMALLRYYLEHELDYLHEQKVRLRFIGDRSALAGELQEKMAAAETRTAENDALTLIIALSYGARQEIVRAAQAYAKAVASGVLTPAAADSEEALAQFSAHLDTAAWPEPDLLVRTGGDQRLSNFLLWQCAYTELYFTDTLWPDFTPDHLRAAIEDFTTRDRRFGKRVE